MGKGSSGASTTDGRTNARVLILTSLAAGPKHGYAMVTDIKEFSGTQLGPGTLYTALQRLEEDGLIAAVSSDDRRRPYRITPAGLTALRAHAADLTRVTTTVGKRLAAR
ncbi:MAG TPA: PadR family transcriptional regulator [Candidatus Limnocylindria bacterium]|nr:PadR family transcriptional regulator [Candidatus Limnocylindria bacterium]